MELIKNITQPVVKNVVQKFQLGSKLNQNEPEVTAYIAGLTTPLSAGQITKLNTFVAALKTGLSISALSDAFDVMYILANETAESGLRNLVKNAHHAEAVNSPTFTALEGYAGNGTSSYIDTKYNPATQGVNYTLNSASFGVYNRTDLVSVSGEMGIVENNNLANIITKGLIIGTNKSAFGINQPSTGALLLDNNNGTGMFVGTRINAATSYLYINKTQNTHTVNSTGLPNGNFFILARNAVGTGAAVLSTKQISFAFTGKLLSQANVNAITDAIEAYMDSNGKGVIS